MPKPRISSPNEPFSGSISVSGDVPGDRSLSSSLLIFSALAIGESVFEALPESENVLMIAAALRAMGAGIEMRGKRWHVHGVGVGGLLQPETALDMGGSSDATLLLMGLVASHPITATFTGDAVMNAQVIKPLSSTGADIITSPGGRLPLMIRGICPAVPIECRLPAASTAMKWAILLAGLNTPGITRVIEPITTVDDAEQMLVALGADLVCETDEHGVRTISLRGEANLKPAHIVIQVGSSSAGLRTS